MPDLKPPEVTLFHTDGCHLCEMAAELLSAMQLNFVHQDICDDEQLAECYGIRIPVLATASGQELNWPFDEAAVKQFLGV
ncbi:MAG: glutaredoxin family protein [Shewanella sp.]|nr:glutaredoxin family protein [Shewanella sp.]MCF1430439.1 glutaredoxin family protein [Shewanella sp.]MCF1437313.1 glutaredoxin family protein [Shewanella sp.]MCF1456927.1 glutaredoxin family protein [Shewanella sp.]